MAQSSSLWITRPSAAERTSWRIPWWKRDLPLACGRQSRRTDLDQTAVMQAITIFLIPDCDGAIIANSRVRGTTASISARNSSCRVCFFFIALLRLRKTGCFGIGRDPCRNAQFYQIRPKAAGFSDVPQVLPDRLLSRRYCRNSDGRRQIVCLRCHRPSSKFAFVELQQRATTAISGTTF